MVAAKQSKFMVSFKESVSSVSVAYDGKGKVCAAEHAQAVEESYNRGYEEASEQYKQQILEFRSDVNTLREGAFSSLDDRYSKIVNEAREALMALTFECVKRVLGGYELNGEIIAKVVEKIVEESGLDDEKMAIHLHPEDLSLLEDFDEELRMRHSGLEFVADNTLQRGDCLLNSRFGKVDGLMSTKLDQIRSSLRPS